MESADGAGQARYRYRSDSVYILVGDITPAAQAWSARVARQEGAQVAWIVSPQNIAAAEQRLARGEPLQPAPYCLAAQTSEPPLKVPPWSPGSNTQNSFLVTSAAAGKPPPKPLPSVMTSGSMPLAW